MPELPEVETLRRSLEPGLVGRTITSVRVLRRDVIAGPGDPVGGFSRQRTKITPKPLPLTALLKGKRIDRLARQGKQLAIVSDDCNASVIVHLGMTGALELDKSAVTSGTLHPKHTHIAWTLDSGFTLRFIDPRRFGLVRAAPKGPETAWTDLGPDALSLRSHDLHTRSQRTSRAIKAVLLDQSFAAGVGNIYADEALFASGIHPERPSRSLDHAEASTLAASIRAILRSAIKQGGSTIRDYRDGSGNEGSFQARHQVYGRAGQPCQKCGALLQGIRVAQRATVLCSVCQPRDGFPHAFHKPNRP